MGNTYRKGGTGKDRTQFASKPLDGSTTVQEIVQAVVQEVVETAVRAADREAVQGDAQAVVGGLFPVNPAAGVVGAVIIWFGYRTWDWAAAGIHHIDRLLA